MGFQDRSVASVKLQPYGLASVKIVSDHAMSSVVVAFVALVPGRVVSFLHEYGRTRYNFFALE